MTFVKFCGITNYEDAKDAIDLGVDALGFNFYPSSPRYISVPDAQTIVRRLPPSIWRVGVFVNYSKEQIQQIAREVGLCTLQFHGDEPDSFLDGWEQWRTIRAIRLGGGAEISLREIHSASSKVDRLLFDSFSPDQFGGTGEQIQAGDIQNSEGDDLATVIKDSFLAGGITPENVVEKIEAFSPWGIDVASGIEVTAGKKSYEKMQSLLAKIHA
jgi:phosphoribosylanthranilate isomerase